jgi:hypothetical protein
MPVTQQYWRIYINGPVNVPGVTVLDVVAIAEVVFLDTENVAIALTGGTASASNFYNGSFVPANAFDGNPNTAWASSGLVSSANPQWLQYQFPAAVPVVAIALSIRNDSAWTTQSPVAFLIQSSPDGSTWTTQNTVTGYTWTSNGQTAYFTASTVVGNARISRAEIEVANLPTPGVLTSQVAIEVANKPTPGVLLSQVSREVIDTPSIPVRASTVAVELLLNASPIVQASQVVVELVYPYEFVPPLPIQQFMLP